jgi:hypothetical protein
VTRCEHPFALFMGGAESPYWRARLGEGGARHVSVNYMQLRKERMPASGKWEVAAKFPEEVEVLADGGGFGAKAEVDHEDHLAAYIHWVAANAPRLVMAIEYDPVTLGLDWLIEHRALYDGLGDLFVPAWHEEHGFAELESLCDVYERVAITAPSAATAARLRPLVARTGVKLHGMAITGPDDIAALSLVTAGSTSWISPTRYGDTQVWAGGRMHWYPKKSQETARYRHHHDVEQAGFDADAYAAGDRKEVARYTVWAWRQFEADVVASRTGADAEIVALSGRVVPTEDRAVEGGSVGHSADDAHTTELVVREPRTPFPGLFSTDVKLEKPQEDGTDTVRIPILSDSNLRRCNSCSLRGKCPGFQPNSTCIFTTELKIRTKPELDSVLSSMLEMEAKRILFARAVEEADGVMLSLDVSSELKTFMSMVEKVRDIQSGGGFFRVEARGAAAGGLISALIGAAAGSQAREQAEYIAPDRAEAILAEVLDVDTEE